MQKGKKPDIISRNALKLPDHVLRRLESSSSPNLLAEVTSEGSTTQDPHVTLVRSNSLPRSPRNKSSHTILELDEVKVRQFRQWLLCIAIVVFDVDYGPRIDVLVPPVDLTAAESENIAFASFPDTSTPHVGSQIHSFRIRASLAIQQEFYKAPEDSEDVIPGSRDDFIYGYCAFVQQRDTTVKRGYSQVSLVILTRHSFPALFTAALTTILPVYAKHGAGVLETACHNISNWATPKPSSTLELGLLGSVLYVELPQHLDQQQLTTTSSFGETFDPNIHILACHPPLEIPAIEVFAAILPSLWSLWECLMLCEPLFIHAASPAIASAAVWWLRDWLRPLPIAGDFRPYFTIHDLDHKRLVNKNTPQQGLIVGTTNPFLYEECKHWPHIISIGSGKSNDTKPGTKHSAPGPPLGFKTTHRRYISKDRALLAQLENALRAGTGRPERLRISDLLRQHFAARATALLVPLNRYLTSLIPTPIPAPSVPQGPQGTPSQRAGGSSIRGRAGTGPTTALPSTKQAASVRPPATTTTTTTSTTPDPTPTPTKQKMAAFNPTDMLASLQKHGGSPLLPFKSQSRQREFYERWMRTNAFGAWLMREESIVERVLAERQDKI
ncbi:DUF1630-domain-containing protein [Serendipita vermifera]|nr:DUF1630-domain-containing protein [Serendipita vermifera]